MCRPRSSAAFLSRPSAAGFAFLVGLTQRSAEGDAALVQIVRRNGHRHGVARQNTNEVLAHLARDVRDDLVPIIKLDAKLRVRKCLHYFALRQKVFFFGHAQLLSLGSWKFRWATEYA